MEGFHIRKMAPHVVKLSFIPYLLRLVILCLNFSRETPSLLLFSDETNGIFKKKMHVKSGMMTLNGGKGSCGWFENVASVCSSWNIWYVCCYDNGFLLVVMSKFDLYVQKEGSCSSLFVTVPNPIKLEVFHLNLRDWIYSRRQLPPWLTLGLWRKSGLGSSPLTATLTPFPPLWNGSNNSSYFLGSHEEDSGGGLCKIFSTVSGKQSSVNTSAVVIFIVIPKFLN